MVGREVTSLASPPYPVGWCSSKHKKNFFSQSKRKLWRDNVNNYKHTASNIFFFFVCSIVLFFSHFFYWTWFESFFFFAFFKNRSLGPSCNGIGEIAWHPTVGAHRLSAAQKFGHWNFTYSNIFKYRFFSSYSENF